jgi:hypothetical protein
MHFPGWNTLTSSKLRFESLLTRFEKPRRYDVYTSDDHRETIEENSRLVDQVDDLNRRLGEAREVVHTPPMSAVPRAVTLGCAGNPDSQES